MDMPGESVVGIIDDNGAAHGAHDIWQFGEWSQNRVGKKGSGEG